MVNILLPILALYGLPQTNNTNSHEYREVVAYDFGEAYDETVYSIKQRDLSDEVLFLRGDAAEAFIEMMGDAAEEGFYIKASSAFRTKKQQAKLRKTKGSLAAKPGWSNHQRGLSVDLCGTTRIIKGKRYRTILYWWLKRNAKRYGFENDVEGEPWHWTFTRGLPKQRGERNYG